MFCPNCGKENPDDSYYCRGCGASLKENAPSNHALSGGKAPVERKKPVSPCKIKSKRTTVLLCIFLGFLGAHRFYVGKYGTGLLYACSFGFLSLGWFFDLFNLICGTFRDKSGMPLL